MNRDWKSLLRELTFMIPIPLKIGKDKNPKRAILIPILIDDSYFFLYFLNTSPSRIYQDHLVLDKLMTKKLLSIFLLQFTLLSIVFARSITVTEEGNIIADTNRYLAKFEKGILTHLHNKLTEETYTNENTAKRRLPNEDKTVFFGLTDFIFSNNNPTIQIISPTSIEVIYGDTERLHLFITIDPNTNDLLINQTGFTPREGAVEVGWTHKNLSHNKVDLIIPGTGGVILNNQSPTSTAYQYPGSWEAQLAIFQGEKGGFFVRSNDTEFKFKRLEYERYQDHFATSFTTIQFAPFAGKNEIKSNTWILNTYEGNWETPALIHRNWMERSFPPFNRNQIPEWVNNIDFVVKNHGEPELGILKRLNELVDPEKTLIFQYLWHQGGGDPPFPADKVIPTFEPYIETAHRYGFKIMPYFSMISIREAHRLYTKFEKYQARNPFTNERMGWRWNDPTYHRPAYINPALRDFRELLVNDIKKVIETHNIDAIQLDLSNLFINDNNGLIDGLTWAKGNIRLHQELRETIPEIVITGEHITEVTFPYHNFTDFWTIQVEQPHPITVFLFSPYTRLFGFLPYPDEEPHLYPNHLDEFIEFGFIPTLIIWDTQSIDTNNPERTQEILEIARQRQGYVFGDINGDKTVNILDLVLIAQELGKEPTNKKLDINKDGIINILDLVIVAQNL